MPAPQRTKRCHPEPWLAVGHGLCSYAAAGVRSLAVSPSTPTCSAHPQALLSSFWVQKPGIRFPEAFTHVGWHRVPPDPARARQTPIGAGTHKPGCRRTAGTGLAWGCPRDPICPGTHSSPLHAAPPEHAGGGAGATHTSTPVECRELCQLTGRNSTRPICCCSCALLKCACSIPSDTFLKSFTAREQRRHAEPQGSPAVHGLNEIKGKIITGGNPTRVFKLLLLLP